MEVGSGGNRLGREADEYTSSILICCQVEGFLRTEDLAAPPYFLYVYLHSHSFKYLAYRNNVPYGLDMVGYGVLPHLWSLN